MAKSGNQEWGGRPPWPGRTTASRPGRTPCLKFISKKTNIERKDNRSEQQESRGLGVGGKGRGSPVPGLLCPVHTRYCTSITRPTTADLSTAATLAPESRRQDHHKTKKSGPCWRLLGACRRAASTGTCLRACRRAVRTGACVPITRAGAQLQRGEQDTTRVRRGAWKVLAISQSYESRNRASRTPIQSRQPRRPHRTDRGRL